MKILKEPILCIFQLMAQDVKIQIKEVYILINKLIYNF